MAAEKVKLALVTIKQVGYHIVKAALPWGAILIGTDIMRLTKLGILPKIMRASGLGALQLAGIVIVAYAVRQIIIKMK